MTPFMLRVTDVLDLPTDVDMPGIRSSRHQPAAVGTNDHVECRSLAEQLVCEANAVLTSSGQAPLSLVDELESGALSFSIRTGGRQARIITDIGRAVSTGHLYGVGARRLGNVELTDPDQVEQLILLLISGPSAAAEDRTVPEPGTVTL